MKKKYDYIWRRRRRIWRSCAFWTGNMPSRRSMASAAFRLEGNGIAISMDSRGRTLDDIFIERLWRSVKQEYVYLNPCETGDELWRGLDGYFRFYNDERLHQSIGYKTPASRYLLKKEAA